MKPSLGTFGLIAVSVGICLRSPNKVSVRRAILINYAAGIVFLSGALVGPLLVMFYPGTEALLRATPVGILKVAEDTSTTPHWLLNIGGAIDEFDNLDGGVAVPLYMLVLSIVGAVISMLLKLPEVLRDWGAITAGAADEAKDSTRLCVRTLKYFVYIVTAPFLVIVAYNIAEILKYNNIPVLSILAVSVGFVSDALVEAMIAFSNSILTRATGGPRKPDQDPAQATAK